MRQHGSAHVLFNEGDKAMLYALWIVVTPVLMAVAFHYGCKLGATWAVAELDKEMTK